MTQRPSSKQQVAKLSDRISRLVVSARNPDFSSTTAERLTRQAQRLRVALTILTKPAK